MVRYDQLHRKNRKHARVLTCSDVGLDLFEMSWNLQCRVCVDHAVAHTFTEIVTFGFLHRLRSDRVGRFAETHDVLGCGKNELPGLLSDRLSAPNQLDE